jgi:hypothetical protein
MSCYAVATAQATVSQEHLLTYLTPENLKEPLTAYLQARFPAATIDASIGLRVGQWTIRQETGPLIVTIENGQITTRDYGRDQAAATALANELGPVLVQIGAAYWQQQVVALLGQYSTAPLQNTPYGSVFLRIQV